MSLYRKTRNSSEYCCEATAAFSDELIKDQVIFGIPDNALREPLHKRMTRLFKCTEMHGVNEMSTVYPILRAPLLRHCSPDEDLSRSV